MSIRRILVATGNEQELAILRELFASPVALVEEQLIGSRVVDRLLNSTFDLLVLSTKLSVMDGFSVVRVLRETGIRTPTIAVAHPGEESRYQEIGCDDVLIRPLDTQQLYESLHRLGITQNAASTTRPIAIRPWTKTIRMLRRQVLR